MCRYVYPKGCHACHASSFLVFRACLSSCVGRGRTGGTLLGGRLLCKKLVFGLLVSVRNKTVEEAAGSTLRMVLLLGFFYLPVWCQYNAKA